MANKSFNFIPPYINGNFISHTKLDRVFQSHNPANPNDILAQAGWNKEFIDPIINGMTSAQKNYQQSSVEMRLNEIQKLIGFLRENSDEIKSNMMLELSRSRLAVEDEWQLCEKLFDLLPSFAKKALNKNNETQGWEWSYAPLGMVLISSNIALPVYSLLCASLPALAAGNAICIRPSSHCLLSGSLLASGFHQTAFPQGLVQFVYGDFDVFRQLLLTHQFNTVLYTGGEESLEQLRRDVSTQANIHLVLCGGGKNASYVTASAHIENSINKILLGSFLDAGQRLESTGLVFCHESIQTEFTEKFILAVKKMPIGAKEDLNRNDMHVMEPLCSSTAWERFLRFQGIAARESKETLRWGKPIDNPAEGYFVSPGVHTMDLEKICKSIYASNAFFGPDVCLVTVKNDLEVSQTLNTLANARCLAIHSQNSKQASEFRLHSDVPCILWNKSTTEINPALPNTGKGNSNHNNVTGLHFLYSTVYPQTLYI